MTFSAHSPHNDINPHVDHYIGIDVGTGSARACIIDQSGDIKACQYTPIFSPIPQPVSTIFEMTQLKLHLTDGHFLQ